MGGLLQQGGRDVLVYNAGRWQLAVSLHSLSSTSHCKQALYGPGVEGGVDSIAMQGSQRLGTPVRVLRRVHGDNAPQASRRNAQSAKERQYVYVYCGRYEVHTSRCKACVRSILMHFDTRQNELGVLASQLVFFASDGVPGHQPPARPLVSLHQCN